MRCNVCGADNLEGSVYCEDCGARLPASAAIVTQEAPPSPPPIPSPPPEAAVQPGPEAVPVAPTPVAAPPVAAGGNVVCAACAATNPAGVAFCEDCGASLGEGAPAPVSGEFTPPVSYDTPSSGQAPAVQTPPLAGSSARLVLNSGKEFPLNKDTILLGRRSPVDGIFPEVDLTDHDTDSYISRRHGRITRSETGLVYEDLGSSNGSFINGARLQANIQQQLNDGDSVRLGKTEMVYRAH